MKVATEDKTQVFMDDNLDVINFWVNQISIARKFYVWLKDLISVRYKIRQASCIKGCDVSNCKCSVEAADNLINTVMKLTLPEVDLDLYNASVLRISANDYAVNKATEFLNNSTLKKPVIGQGTGTSSSSSKKLSGGDQTSTS